MMWLVTGAGGMLGREVLERLARERRRGDRVVGLDRAALDITEPDAVRAVFARHSPEVVVNCAAYTAVEDAETHEFEALRINGDGPRHLAEVCAEHRARLIQVSTDYVFAGDARAPFPEGHPPAPRTAYGRTKLAGERAVLDGIPELGTVVRTAWLYGAGGRSFVSTMLLLEARQATVEVVDDQWGQPTWAADAAERIVILGRQPNATGIFHATNSGTATWYELAREVFQLAGADPDRVRPTRTEAFPGLAPRPDYTVLGHGRWQELGVAPPRDWRCALADALKAPGGRSLGGCRR